VGRVSRETLKVGLGARELAVGLREACASLQPLVCSLKVLRNAAES
jgi:hypothetical protein